MKIPFEKLFQNDQSNCFYLLFHADHVNLDSFSLLHILNMIFYSHLESISICILLSICICIGLPPSDLHIFATELATGLIKKLSKSIHFHICPAQRTMNNKIFYSYYLLKSISCLASTGATERLDVLIHIVKVVVDLLNLDY